MNEPLRMMRPLPRAAVLVTALVAAALAFAGTLLKVFDPDTFHHLAMGRHIVRHGLSAGEPFLFPFLGASVGPPPYWLGSVLVFGWHALTGDAGLPFLPATIAAVLAVVLLADTAPRSGRHTPVTLAASAAPLVLALEGFRYRAVGRPELFAMLFVVLTLWAVRRLEDDRPRLVYAFPALALLWANVHPSVVVGVAIVFLPAALGALRLARARASGRASPDTSLGRQVAISAIAGTAGLLAACVSPSADNPIALAFRFLSSATGFRALGPAVSGAAAAAQNVVSSIPEMRPVTAHFWIEPFGILLILTASTFLLHWRAARPREVLTVALFAVLGLGAARFAPLLALVCAPIAARNLGELLARVPERLGRVPVRALATAACALGAAAALPLASMESMLCPGTGFRPGAYPTRGVDYLEAAGFDGVLFNTFQFGGYLSWREIGPPYQDGRGMIRAGEELAAMRGPLDRPTFAALDRKYRFDALLLAYPDEQPSSTARFGAVYGDSDWTADRETWSLVAFDDGGLLYLRRDGVLAERAARDEFRTAMPANTAFSPRAEQIPALLSEFRRAVREAPGCVLCRYYHAVAALSVGRVDEARQSLSTIRSETCIVRPFPIDDAWAEVERATARGR